jgi:hypothetical protein
MNFDLNITREAVLIIVSALLILAVLTLFNMAIRSLKGLNVKYFRTRWRDILKLAKDRRTWPQVVIEADKLVDEALKKRHFKGKTMGERLISASKELRDQDGIWKAHKIRNKLVHEEGFRVKKAQMIYAMEGYKKALQDLGAL